MASATRKIVLVTGGNNGIGYETVKALLTSPKPYHILLGARLGKAPAAVSKLHSECPGATNTLVPLDVDLTSDASIEKAYEQVKNDPGHLDVLINNAGATFDIEYQRGKVSLRESFTRSYDVNVAGTHVLTHVFIPLLLKSADPRLLFISGLSGITTAAVKYGPTPPQPAGWPKPKPEHDFETIGYRCSKVALNMLMLDWNHKLQADGVKVWCVGPGILATGLGGFGPEKAKEILPFLGHASEGGDVIRRVVEGERDEDTGKFVVKNGGFTEW